MNFNEFFLLLVTLLLVATFSCVSESDRDEDKQDSAAAADLLPVNSSNTSSTVTTNTTSLLQPLTLSTPPDVAVCCPATTSNSLLEKLPTTSAEVKSTPGPSSNAPPSTVITNAVPVTSQLAAIFTSAAVSSASTNEVSRVVSVSQNIAGTAGSSATTSTKKQTHTYPTSASSAGTTRIPPVVKYVCQYRIINKSFSTALSDKASSDYNSLRYFISPPTYQSFKDSFGDLFVSIDDVSFSAGSIIVNVQFTLRDYVTNDTLNQTGQTLIINLAKYISLQVDGASFVLLLPPALPAPSNSFDNALLGGIVAGLIAVVAACVVALSVLVCRRQWRSKGLLMDTDSQATVDYSQSGSATDGFSYQPNSPAGLPSARPALVWKGNKTAMNNPEEFDGNFTYWRPENVHPSIGLSRNDKRRGAYSPSRNRRQVSRLPDPSQRQQNSETESSDWRYVAQESESNSRPLTERLKRAIMNAAHQSVSGPPVGRNPRNGQHKKRRNVTIIDDVDDESDSSWELQTTSANPAQAERPSGAVQSSAWRYEQQSVGRMSPWQAPPARRLNQPSDFRNRPSGGVTNSFNQDNARWSAGGYGQAALPTGAAASSHLNNRLQRRVYMPN